MTRWVSGKHYQSNEFNVYHTDSDCQHVTPGSRTLEESTADPEELRECKFCAGEGDPTPQTPIVCPYCGETVGQIPTHLPCEASQ